jgi:glycosyltransferase involved in cell wall biosynthesis
VRARHGIAPDAPVFGVVGNIRRWKGQETAVRATALLRRRHPRVRCLLVGAVSEHDADYEAKLRSICEAEGLGEHVVFAGFQRNAIDYMAAMDVVAHTSVDPEPFGIVTLEAMLLSRPLVSTTIGGPTEVVIDGQTGQLVEPADPQALAAAIDELLSDPKAAQGMGKAGYERLLAEFTMKDCAAKTMHVYAQILDPA